MLIESNPFLLVLISVLASIVFLADNLISQLILETRNKISFANYQKKKSLFTKKPSPIRVILYCVVFSYSFVILILASLSNVTRVYVYVLIPTVIILIFLFICELTIGKKNKNISIFDSEFSKIKFAMESRNSAIMEYDEYSKAINAFETKWMTIFDDVDTYATQKILRENRPLEAAHDLLNKLRTDIDGFDSICIQKFNSKLVLFVTNGTFNSEVELESIAIPLTRKIESLIQEAELINKKLIYDFTKESISTKTIINSDSLIHLLSENNKLNNDIKDLSLSAVELIEELPYKNDAINFVYDKGLISEEDVLKCIDMHIFCVFEYDVYAYFSSKSYESIFLRILEKDDSNFAIMLLRKVRLDRIDTIKSIIYSVPTENSCTRLARTYLDVFDVKFGFADTANSYENMAFSLFNYYDVGTLEYSWLGKIVDQESFIKNKDEILKSYTEASKDVESLKISFIKSLIAYRDSWCANKQIFDFNKIVNLYKEFASTLNVVRIKKLICLVSSVVLIEENDKQLVDEALDSIKKTGLLSEYYKGKVTSKSSSSIGRTMLNKILSDETKLFLPILYRIEADRLSYEKLVKM